MYFCCLNQNIFSLFRTSEQNILGVLPSPRDSTKRFLPCWMILELQTRTILCQSHPTWRLWRNLHTKNITAWSCYQNIDAKLSWCFAQKRFLADCELLTFALLLLKFFVPLPDLRILSNWTFFVYDEEKLHSKCRKKSHRNDCTEKMSIVYVVKNFMFHEFQLKNRTPLEINITDN